MVEKAWAGDGAELRSSGHNEDLIRPESGVRPETERARDRRGQSTSDTGLVTISGAKVKTEFWVIIIPSLVSLVH